MSDDTRAPRQPFDDGPQPEAGIEAGEPRELPDVQDQLEAALARSRGIGEDGDVAAGEVLAGDDLAFDGRAEAPTDPALAPQEDVTVAFADPLAADNAGEPDNAGGPDNVGEPDNAVWADPNATVGLDRDELAAVLANGPVERSGEGEPDPAQSSAGEAQADGMLQSDVPSPVAGASDAEALSHTDAPSQAEPHGVAEENEAHSGADSLEDSGFAAVPVAERVIPEEDDAAMFPVTEPVPAQDLAANAIGAESVAAITVDAAGSATAPDDDTDAPRRTLEIDRTAARVAAVVPAAALSTSNVDGSLNDTRSDEPGASDARDVDGDAGRAEVLVTATVTEQLSDDGESVEAVTVTKRVDVVDSASVVNDEPAALATGADTRDTSEVSGPAESSDAADATGATEATSTEQDGLGSPAALTASETDTQEPLRDGETDSGTDGGASAGASAASGDDDSTFAPLRLSAPTDSDDLAPVKPKKRGNRMFAVFVALVASVVFAALYLLAFALLRTAFNTGLDPIGEASEFAITAAFTVPVTVFAAFGVLWALIVNRAGWWAYVLGGFLAAVLVAAGYYFGAALQQHLADGLPITSIQLDEVLAKFRASEHLLTALVAAIAAREAFTWVGGIAAARGRRVSRANRRAKLSYEKRMAERAAETAEANGVAE